MLDDVAICPSSIQRRFLGHVDVGAGERREAALDEYLLRTLRVFLCYL